ncbi:hypothetical protein FRB94_008528 [Tulasnella sp. JGI-2019a]|nr:hypothetical protein FRB93_008912 [Tulasnella sp. JGI-2019a]KAG8996167.1 hypothetical protein FRB94_008528 [Tulasnella sp. JGI-2019a]
MKYQIPTLVSFLSITLTLFTACVAPGQTSTGRLLENIDEYNAPDLYNTLIEFGANLDKGYDGDFQASSPFDEIFEYDIIYHLEYMARQMDKIKANYEDIYPLFEKLGSELNNAYPPPTPAKLERTGTSGLEDCLDILKYLEEEWLRLGLWTILAAPFKATITTIYGFLRRSKRRVTSRGQHTESLTMA